MMDAHDLAARYRRVHRTGQDCRLTTARNLLELAGHRHGYTTVQGLASSFFFSYRRRFSAHDLLSFPGGDHCAWYWPVSGHRVEVLENLAYVADARLLMHEGQDAASAEAGLREHLGHGIAVMVAVSRAVLARHLGHEHRFPACLRGLRLGGHFVLVVGIDEANDAALIFDTDYPSMLRLPLPVLAEARCSGDGDRDCLMQSHNRWGVFLPGPSLPPLAPMMRSALTRTAVVWRAAEADPEATGGLPALRRFAEELPGWTNEPGLDADKLQASIFMLRLMSDRLAGGSLGRRAFGIFLRQAGDALRDVRLLEAAACYAELTLLWPQLLGAVEAQAAEGRSLDTPAIRATLARIVDHEVEGIGRVQQAMEIGR